MLCTLKPKKTIILNQQPSCRLLYSLRLIAIYFTNNHLISQHVGSRVNAKLNGHIRLYKSAPIIVNALNI